MHITKHVKNIMINNKYHLTFSQKSIASEIFRFVSHITDPFEESCKCVKPKVYNLSEYNNYIQSFIEIGSTTLNKTQTNRYLKNVVFLLGARECHFCLENRN